MLLADIQKKRPDALHRRYYAGVKAGYPLQADKNKEQTRAQDRSFYFPPCYFT